MFRKASLVIRNQQARARNYANYGLAGGTRIEDPLVDNAINMEAGTDEDIHDNASDEGHNPKVDAAGVNLHAASGPTTHATVPTEPLLGSQNNNDNITNTNKTTSSSIGSIARKWQHAGKAASAAAKLAQTTLPYVQLPGNVQGIDLTRRPDDWSWLSDFHSADCNITCVDFSPDRVALRSELTNASLADFVKQERPSWSKVRWLSIDRLSWDVVQTLALRYNIHPLAVEDVLHIPQRVKADFYERFLYINLVLITLPSVTVPDGVVAPIRPASAVRSAVARCASTPRGAKTPPPAPTPAVKSAASSSRPDVARAADAAAVAVSCEARDPSATASPASSRRGSVTASGMPTGAVAQRSAPSSTAKGRASGPFGNACAVSAPDAADDASSVPVSARAQSMGRDRFDAEDIEVALSENTLEGTDVLASLPARRLGRSMSISRPAASLPTPRRRHMSSDLDPFKSSPPQASHETSARHVTVNVDPNAVSSPAHVAATNKDTGDVREPEESGGCGWRFGKDESDLRASRHLTRLPLSAQVYIPTPTAQSNALPTSSPSASLGHGTRVRNAAFGAGSGGAPTYSTEHGIPVHRQQVGIFVVDDNTIISIFEASGSVVTRCLLQQLRDPHTLARDACDASYLLCLLLDALADSLMPVVDNYGELIEGYEAGVLGGQPKAGLTRELHLVQQDLATLRRTVLPTLHLVTALRSHATTRASIGGWQSNAAASGAKMHNSHSSGDVAVVSTVQAPPGGASGGGAGVPTPAKSVVRGAAGGGKSDAALGPKPLVSPLTKTYLTDVQDHLTTVLDAVDSQVDACRDLIDLAFNLIAHRTNEAMQALTVVSVLFLPLTFLAGIYGMNFDYLPELHWRYGYLYFYGMCGVICVLFLGTMIRLGLLNSG